uniref:Chitin-binding type-2 domain-containing protein n=1 Tax=Caenorhabditis tropicalis TaxID=1561998 RepID=A0A1I7T1Y1_9PELO
MISQQELLGTEVQGRYRYICGSDPYRFYSEFPCNMYPVCINGGFKINVGCNQDYQCTPYSSNAVCTTVAVQFHVSLAQM